MGASSPAGRAPAAWVFVAIGSVFVLSALVVNEWVLGPLLTHGGRVTNPTSRILLGIFDAAALGVGLLLLIRRERSPWRQMLLMSVALVFAVVLAEAVPRLWFGMSATFEPRDREIVKGIGWRPVENLSTDREVPGFGRVRYNTVKDGFRVFGDSGSSKPKVLAIGDSFTEAVMVNDGEAYYHHLAKVRPDLEWFAIGAGGYGTLQEYMLLDQVVDTVKPDLVLLQMHPNDLINNSHALESRSTTNSNQMTRPYWEQGRVVERFPENREWGALYRLVRHSYLLRLLNVNLLLFRSKSADSIERTLDVNDPDVINATEATVELLRMIRERSRVPVVAFAVRSEQYFAFWSRAEVCRRAGIRFIPGVGEAVDAAAERGEPVTGAPVDSHWNGRGHEMAARLIDAWLRREGLPAR
jgi:hypothetical protein